MATILEQVKNLVEPEAQLQKILETGFRRDKRGFRDARDISFEFGLLPSAQGSVALKKGNKGNYICEVHGTIFDAQRSPVQDPHITVARAADVFSPEVSVCVRMPEIGDSDNCGVYGGKAGLAKPSYGGNFIAGDLGRWGNELKYSGLDDICSAVSCKVHRILSSPAIIDFAKLAVSDRYSWRLHFDILCLSFDGNLLDGALTAAILGLADLALPALGWDSEVSWFVAKSEDIVCPAVKGTDILRSIPVCITCSMALDSFWVVDPSWEEVSSGNTVSVVCVVRVDDIVNDMKWRSNAKFDLIGNCFGNVSMKHDRIDILDLVLSESMEAIEKVVRIYVSVFATKNEKMIIERD